MKGAAQTVLLVGMAVVVGWRISKLASYSVVPTVLAARTTPEDERIFGLAAKTYDLGIKYWTEIVNRQPDYRDGYIQLAVINWQLAKKEEARSWIIKALEVDPNYVLSPTLLELLQKD